MARDSSIPVAAPERAADAAEPADGADVAETAEVGEPRDAAAVVRERVPARTQSRVPSPRAMRNRLARMGGGRNQSDRPELEPLFRSIRNNHPKADLALIERAYRTAEHLHGTQMRKSGDPYITHPLAVATILADIGMTEPTLVAALLHDTVEDTPYTLDELRSDFGDEVARLVAEVRAQLVEGVRRVLDRVVEQRGDQRRLGHADVGQDGRHRQRMGDVGVAALAHLGAVELLGGAVGALDQREVGLGVVGADRAEQRLQLGTIALVAPAAHPGQPVAHRPWRGHPRLRARRDALADDSSASRGSPTSAVSATSAPSAGSAASAARSALPPGCCCRGHAPSLGAAPSRALRPSSGWSAAGRRWPRGRAGS